jgi:hypothetical protein
VGSARRLEHQAVERRPIARELDSSGIEIDADQHTATASGNTSATPTRNPSFVSVVGSVGRRVEPGNYAWLPAGVAVVDHELSSAQLRDLERRRPSRRLCWVVAVRAAGDRR